MVTMNRTRKDSYENAHACVTALIHTHHVQSGAACRQRPL